MMTEIAFRCLNERPYVNHELGWPCQARRGIPRATAGKSSEPHIIDQQSSLPLRAEHVQPSAITMNSDNSDPAAGGSSSSSKNAEQPSSSTPRHQHARPNYLTVGSGSTSEHAAHLQALLDDDSGYGGSLADGESFSNSWHPGITEDRPTPPAFSPGNNPNSEGDRRTLASHIHQLYYNQNKSALGRAITRTVDTLRRLQEFNAAWPAHYPTVHRPESTPNAPSESRPGLQHTQSTIGTSHEYPQSSAARPAPLRRAGTSLGEDRSQPESSSAAPQRPTAEPRLVTPQLAQDFSILKIDLKLGNLSQTDLVHSLEKSSIASLLDGQISKSIKHLYSLRERIEDTSSKVLVTGDLNAGKSTFCNALLRRKVLPEDQQPCTSIFCEVLDARENGGREEVHAIPNGCSYERNDERTYEVFDLKDLEKIVIDPDKWSQCKVYVRDTRSVDESLLNNGVVDIALIDAPGLNNDSLKTTAVFARQEEIDVVVFVVSAANHFTLSAKEFIFNAAREKAYIFMVVNGYDNIRDKQRCQDMILKQVAHLSPATFKEASELVHFVSSNAIPTAPLEVPNPGGPGGSGGSGSASGSGFEISSGDPDGGDDDDSGDPNGKGKGKGKEREKLQDFEELEQSLRRFVLEKRARSKLAPAKTYLMNVLSDLGSLSTVNRDVAQAELDRVTGVLAELEPQLEKSKRATTDASDTSDRLIEDTASDVYDHTTETLNQSISHVAQNDLGIKYPGLLGALQYADDLKSAMIQEIANTVGLCEEQARQRTVKGVNAIKSLGLLHLGNGFADIEFRSDLMFRKKRDMLARQVDFDVDAIDFFDFPSLWERQEKVAGTSMALTVAGVVGGRLIGGFGWFDGALNVARIVGPTNLRKLVVPGMIATGMTLGLILLNHLADITSCSRRVIRASKYPSVASTQVEQ